MEDKGLLNNLINNEVEADASVAKVTGLGAASTFAAFSVGLLINAFLTQGSGAYIAGGIIATIIFLALFFLNVLFIKTVWIANLVILAESVALVGGVYSAFSPSSVLGGIITFFVLMSAAYSGREYFQNLLKIRFWQTAKGAVSRAIIGIAFFVSIVSYSNIEKIMAHQDQFFISASTFEQLLVKSTSAVKYAIPEMDFTKSVGEVITNIATQQVAENEEAQRLPQAAQKQLIAQTKEELHKKIAAYFAVAPEAINLRDVSSKALYDITAQKFNKLDAESKKQVAGAVAAIVFITAIGLILPLRLCATLLAVILYEILLGLNFAAVTLEGRSREIIILK